MQSSVTSGVVKAEAVEIVKAEAVASSSKPEFEEQLSRTAAAAGAFYIGSVDRDGRMRDKDDNFKGNLS